MDSQTDSIRQPILSLILLTVLVIIVASILALHWAYTPPPVPDFLIKQASSSSQQLTDKGLTFSSPSGFKQAGEPEIYSPESLFEKINGKAPLYLDSGFTNLQTQRFAHNSNSQLWFEVSAYDMTADSNAFSVYSTQRRPDTADIPSLENVRNYITENGIFIQHGRYYIECVGSSTNELLKEAMIKTMQSLIAQNSITPSTISEIDLFPRQGLAPNSLKLYLGSTFGSDALTNTFIGQYTIDNLPVTAFISSQQDSSQAIQVADGYYRFLIESGGTPIPIEGKTIRYIDLYGTIESIFNVSRYAGGVHEAEDLQSAQLISERLLKTLLEQKSP